MHASSPLSKSKLTHSSGPATSTLRSSPQCLQHLRTSVPRAHIATRSPIHLLTHAPSLASALLSESKPAHSANSLLPNQNLTNSFGHSAAPSPSLAVCTSTPPGSAHTLFQYYCCNMVTS